MLNHAEITGWGKYVPPLLMTNEDMAKIVDTSDEWIYSRSGIRQRYYSHISTGDMAWLAGEQALAAAAVDAQSSRPRLDSPDNVGWQEAVGSRQGRTVCRVCCGIRSSGGSWYGREGAR